ncbi:MAG: hypothetical protein WCQ95_08975 [Bacteroidota bacterium]
MKKLYIILFIGCISFELIAQNKPVGSEILSRNAITKIFTDSVLRQFNINFPIFRVYKCNDNSGQFYIALTESNDSIAPSGDTISKKIRALNLSIDQAGLTKKWELNDFKTKLTYGDDQEYSIWFWTRYVAIDDLDADQLLDPILIYGTSGKNGYEDGRIKIIVFHNGSKIAIRHQNGALDFERNTQVDKEFYDLPLTIQNKVKEIMARIEDDNRAIFPAGWQKAMNNKSLKFDENHH